MSKEIFGMNDAYVEAISAKWGNITISANLVTEMVERILELEGTIMPEDTEVEVRLRAIEARLDTLSDAINNVSAACQHTESLIGRG